MDHDSLPGVNKTIFAFGGGFNKVFLRYIMELTGKANPKICFVPTATGDNPNTILGWYSLCEDEAMRPYVLRTYISSYNTKTSFEDQLLGMDAIVVGGGNTQHDGYLKSAGHRYGVEKGI